MSKQSSLVLQTNCSSAHISTLWLPVTSSVPFPPHGVGPALGCNSALNLGKDGKYCSIFVSVVFYTCIPGVTLK